MDAGSYCRGADSPQALTLVAHLCAHDTRGNSPRLQLSTWSKLVIETEKPLWAPSTCPSGTFTPSGL